MNPKEYQINSIDDICNVINAENQERFIIDIAMAFKFYCETITQLRKKLPKKDYKEVKNSDIMGFAFKWVDDGKHEHLSTTIEVNHQKHPKE